MKEKIREVLVDTADAISIVNLSNDRSALKRQKIDNVVRAATEEILATVTKWHNDERSALMPRWVPVSERLPRKAGRYPVISRIDDCSCLDTLYFSKRGEWYEGAVCEFDVKQGRYCHLVRTVFAWFDNLPAAPEVEG